MNNITGLVRDTFNRRIPPDVDVVERNGYIFFVSKSPFDRRCFGPLAGMAGGLAGGIGGLLAGAGGILEAAGPFIGPIMGMLGTKKEGKESEKISEERQRILLRNAELSVKYGQDKSLIIAEEALEAAEKATAKIASANIKTNVGSPLVIKAQIKADAAKSVGFVMERAREEEKYYKTLAWFEEQAGKAKKKKSSWDMLSGGLGLAGMGLDMFGGGGLSGLFGGGNAIGGLGGGLTTGNIGSMFA